MVEVEPSAGDAWGLQKSFYDRQNRDGQQQARAGADVDIVQSVNRSEDALRQLEGHRLKLEGVFKDWVSELERAHQTEIGSLQELLKLKRISLVEQAQLAVSHEVETHSRTAAVPQDDPHKKANVDVVCPTANDGVEEFHCPGAIYSAQINTVNGVSSKERHHGFDGSPMPTVSVQSLPASAESSGLQTDLESVTAITPWGILGSLETLQIPGKNRDSLAWTHLETSSHMNERMIRMRNEATIDADKRWAYKVSRSAPIQFICSFMIMLNALSLGVTADHDLKQAIRAGAAAEDGVPLIELFFLVWFSFELALRIAAERRAFVCGKDWSWNALDASLVTLSLLDVSLSGQNNALRSVEMARMLRIIRFARILRLFRAVRAFQSFRIMLQAIMESMASLFWCLLVITFIIYVFGLLFVHGVTEHFSKAQSRDVEAADDLIQHFGTLFTSMVSLFEAISGGKDWGELIFPMEEVGEIYSFIFISYIFFMFFGVLNVVIGAFVASTSDIRERDREAMVKAEVGKLKKYSQKIKTFFQEADVDKSGMLSYDEFRSHLSKKEVKAYFQSLELDVSQATTLFKLLDIDGSGQVECDEFLAGCLRLKGQAKNIDLHMLMYNNDKMCTRLAHLSKEIEDAFKDIDVKMSMPSPLAPTTRRSMTSPLAPTTPAWPPCLLEGPH